MNADRADQALVGGDSARPSIACETFIKGWEKCRLTPYLDEGEKWTVGWGHLMASTDDKTASITQAEADALFDYELCHFADGISKLIFMPMTQYQYDAVVAFSYNCGLGALATSSLRKCIEDGNFTKAATWFSPWNQIEKPPSSKHFVVSDGLTKRRAAERAIFVSADYSGRP
jgi:lysozyme